MRRLLALVVALALAAPAPALAQDGSPFDGLPPAPPPPAPTVETPDSSDEDDVGRNTLYAIAGGLLVAFVAVGWWISRDARRAVPGEDRRERDRLREEGPHRKARQAKAKARAKGRAQRAARKRTRR